MTTLLIATRNSHKVEEIRTILGAKLQYLTLTQFPGAPSVKEDAATFAGNATKKAVELARWLANHPSADSRVPRLDFVLADDSGLEVDALNGAPGVLSARFAAMDSGTQVNASDAENNAKLLRLLRDVPAPKRTARFRCILALCPVQANSPSNASPVCSADELELRTELFEGNCEGGIDFAPSGRGGFGYDPLFIPTGFQRSFGDLGEETKNRISHRSKALAKLRERLAARA